jgi:gamma-glutamylcyclotransferase (GGCT)/AIG2-like uncharacterized protein YtfP
MYYFAYGSNLNSKWMKKRCPDTKLLGPARLPDYQLAFRYKSTSWPGGGAADILFKPGREVWGGLYLSNEKDFISLDKYEDVTSNGYERITVEVELEGKTVTAVSYEVKDKLQKDLNPLEGYLQLMINGAKQIPLPEYYIKRMIDHWY